MSDPWDTYVKTYPIGIHSSQVHKPNDLYPVYEIPESPIEPEPVISFAVEYPSYLYKYLVGVHGKALYRVTEPHWFNNPNYPE